MKIAIIGGGAAGIITAYYLHKNGHDVDVFEKSNSLGGHIRTSNKNCHVEGIASDLYLEGGVIEFSEEFHHFKALLKELNVPTEPVAIGTGLFLSNGKHILSPTLINNNFKGAKRFAELLKFWGFSIKSASLAKQFKNVNPANFSDLNLEDILKHDGYTEKWVKLLMMYCYSIAYPNISTFSAEVALYNLKHYMMADWFRIKGGVYSYIEKILHHFTGNIYTDTAIKEIKRESDCVTIQTENDKSYTYQKVALATPPDQILKLLANPTPEEIKWFTPWTENKATTIIHTDAALYSPHKIKQASEFDFFKKTNDWGYNALLNNVCGIPQKTPFYLAYNLQDRINVNSIVTEITHATPNYTAAAIRYRKDVLKNNGLYNTLYAGAWLSDGLHEGAVVSAQNVAKIIGV